MTLEYSIRIKSFSFIINIRKTVNFVIKTPTQIKKKLELLESLRDIQIAHKLVDVISYKDDIE